MVYKKFKFLFFLIFITLTINKGYLYSDTIKMKDGRTIIGETTKKGNKIIIKTRYGSFTVNMNDVLSIKKPTTDKEIYEEKLKSLMKSDANGYYKVGLWCLKHKGFKKKAKDLFEYAIKVNPDHAGARRKLGFYKLGKSWYKPVKCDFKKTYLVLKKYKENKKDKEIKKKRDKIVHALFKSVFPSMILSEYNEKEEYIYPRRLRCKYESKVGIKFFFLPAFKIKIHLNHEEYKKLLKAKENWEITVVYQVHKIFLKKKKEDEKKSSSKNLFLKGPVLEFTLMNKKTNKKLFSWNFFGLKTGEEFNLNLINLKKVFSDFEKYKKIEWKALYDKRKVCGKAKIFKIAKGEITVYTDLDALHYIKLILKKGLNTDGLKSGKTIEFKGKIIGCKKKMTYDILEQRKNESFTLIVKVSTLKK